MSVVRSVAAGRRAFERHMWPDECSITAPNDISDAGGALSPGTPTSVTSPCRLTAVSGAEAGEDQVKERGNYRLALPVDVAISAVSTVTVLGKSYSVVWVPPVTALTIERTVGLKDA